MRVEQKFSQIWNYLSFIYHLQYREVFNSQIALGWNLKIFLELYFKKYMSVLPNMHMYIFISKNIY